MSRPTKVPAIPAPTKDNLLEVARAVKGTLEVREGLAGDPEDAFVRRRDLNDPLFRETYSVADGVGGGIPGPVGPAGPPGTPTPPDTTPPPAPTGLTADAALTTIILQWDSPPVLYAPNHAYTEVWRFTSDTIGSAVLIGTSNTQFYNDSIGEPATGYYYWVRFMSRADITGPYNSSSGTYAETGVDPARLLELLTGQIKDSHLYQALGKPISQIGSNADDAAALALKAALAAHRESVVRAQEFLSEAENRVYAVNASAQAAADAVAQEATDRAAALLQEQSDRAQAVIDVFNDLSGDIAAESTILRTEFADADVATLASANSFTYSRATIDSSIAGTMTTLRAEFAGADAVTLASANSYTYSRATIDSADAATLSTLRAEFAAADSDTLDSAEAYVQSYGYSFANADSAIAVAFDTVSARLDSGGDVYGSIVTVDSKAQSALDGLGTQATQITLLQSGIATRRGVFREDWEAAAALSRWASVSGSGELSVVTVADGQGGKALRVGNSSGNDQAWLIHQDLIPFDSARTYRITARVRRLAGSGVVYLGWAGVAADGVTYVNTAGSNTFSSQHYHAAAGVGPSAAWQTYVGYSRGFGASAGTGVAGTMAAPGSMHPSVRYLRPLILVNFSAASGTTEVDSFVVEDAEAEVASGDVLATLISEYSTTATVDSAIATAKTTLRAEFADADSDTLSSATNYTNDYAYSKAAVDGQVETVASSIDSLSVQIRGGYTGVDLGAVTSGLIYQERSARVTLGNSLTQQISLLSAGSNNQFDYSDIWYFDADLEGWTGPVAGTTASAVAGWMRLISNSGSVSNAYLVSPDNLGVDGSKYPQVRMRIRKVGSPVWEGSVYFITTADGTYNVAKLKTVSEPTYDAGIALLTFDMPATWTGATIRRLRIDLSGATTTTDYFEIDWVAVGRPSPGASSSQLLEEQEARASADAAEASSRETLASQLRGSYAGSDITLITSGLIASERNARTTADSSEVTARQALSSKITGTTNPASLTLATLSSGLLYDERTARTTADTAQVSRLTALEATVNNPTTGVTATASALDSVELIVNHGTSGNSALATRTGLLEATVNNPTTGVAATAVALDSVELIVTNGTSGNSALATRTGLLETSINTPSSGLLARAAALETVTTHVDSGNSALASKVTTLQSTVRAGTSGSLLPSTFDDGTAYWTNVRDGNPATIATATGTKITNDASFGTCLEISDWSGAGANILTKGVVPAIAGRVYRVTARFKVTGGDGSAQFTLIVEGQSTSYTVANVVTPGYAAASTGVVTEITATLASAPSTGVVAWPSGAVYLRPGLRLGASDPGLVIRVQSIKIEDVTAETELSASLEVEASTRAALDGSVQSLYTVRTEVSSGGRTVVGGFGLSGTATATEGPRIDFGVRADRFWVGAPSTTGSITDVLPFVIQATPTTINGEAVPAGVYMDAVFIKNGTLTSAQIGSLVANKITAGYTASVDIEAGTFVGSEFYIGGTVTYAYGNPAQPLQRTGIASVANPNVAINASGATFNVNYFRILNGTTYDLPFEVVGGVVKIRNAAINNAAIGSAQISATIQSDNYSSTLGWQINKAGTFYINELVARGSIKGGSFTGYVWPGPYLTGYYLGPEGLLLGNYGSGQYFQVEASGNIYTPQFSVVSGSANYSGTFSVGASPALSGTAMTGSGAKINPSGTFALGNSAGSITFNGTVITLNGDVVGTGNIKANNISQTYSSSGAGSAAVGGVVVGSGEVAVISASVESIVATGFVIGSLNTYRGATVIASTMLTPSADSSGGEFSVFYQAGATNIARDSTAGTHTFSVVSSNSGVCTIVVTVLKR